MLTILNFCTVKSSMGRGVLGKEMRVSEERVQKGKKGYSSWWRRFSAHGEAKSAGEPRWQRLSCEL